MVIDAGGRLDRSVRRSIVPPSWHELVRFADLRECDVREHTAHGATSRTDILLTWPYH